MTKKISQGALVVNIVLMTGAATGGVDAPSFSFTKVDGGIYETSEWRGMPVMLGNTVSVCGYIPQYKTLQDLSDQ